MSLDERLRSARPTAQIDAPIDVDSILRNSMRAGARRRQAWRASVALSVALIAVLVSIPVVRNLSQRESDVADRIQQEEQKRKRTAEEREQPGTGSAPGHPAPGGREEDDGPGNTSTEGTETRSGQAPDRIAFVAAGSDEIYVMNSDGSGKTLLGPGAEPDWSPDGKQILYSRGQTTAGCSSTPTSRVDPPDPCELWIMNADGSGQRRLAAGSRADWSPDGRRIAYAAGQGDTEIHVMNADGSGSVRLTDTPEYSTSPSWSPDGTQIAFTRRDSCGSACWDVYLTVMDADGSDMERVSYGGGAADPAWSRDGQRIVFSSVATGGGDNHELFTVKLADGEVTRLTHDEDTGKVMDNFDAQPAWGLDGRIVFMRDPDGPTGGGACYATNAADAHCGTGGPAPSSIFVMDADGTGRTRLGEGRMPDVAPR